MQSYYMPQSTVYFDQRFSPTLLLNDTPKTNGVHAVVEGLAGDSDELSAKE